MSELYQICSYYLNKLLQNKNELFGNELKEQYKLNNLVDLCKIGNVLNLDLLSELLININPCNFKELNNEEKNTRLVNIINKFMVINFMFNNLIDFLKQKYNYELNGVISDNYYRLRLSVIRSNLLNNDSYFNEDMLSNIVDDYQFSNVLINEWSLLKDKLLIINNTLVDIDSNIELNLYKAFIKDLIIFIDNRMVKLEPKYVEKVMVRRFRGE